jgi:ADP-heptose:LPS heptosyltransferase
VSSKSGNGDSQTARLLIIRFSSFGDLIQASGVPEAFCQAHPGAEIDWLARADFADLLDSHPKINRVISFPRSQGIGGLLRLAWKLAEPNSYTHVYDAHNNVRSFVVLAVFFLRSAFGLLSGDRPPQFARRPKSRLKRWLFFRLRLRTFPMPFRGAESFHRPLSKWGIPPSVPAGPQFRTTAQLPPEVFEVIERLPRPLIAAAPSAAWEMKRWPLEHWKKLIGLLPEAGFALLGGPEDAFLEELAAEAPGRVANLAGRLSLAQSASLLQLANLVIANDTGILHVADQMERPTLALIGPTAFGYPSHKTSEALEIELPCKPCSKDGRGGCSNSIYQRCLVELSPERVAGAAETKLGRASLGVSEPS